jgi:hypothetical protein
MSPHCFGLPSLYGLDAQRCGDCASSKRCSGKARGELVALRGTVNLTSVVKTIAREAKHSDASQPISYHWVETLAPEVRRRIRGIETRGELPTLAPRIAAGENPFKVRFLHDALEALRQGPQDHSTLAMAIAERGDVKLATAIKDASIALMFLERIGAITRADAHYHLRRPQ